MKINHQSANNPLTNIFNPPKGILTTVNDRIEVVTGRAEIIRFEEKKERYFWAHPDEIIFIKSADHYVKSLINCSNQKKWMTRHCTLKELFIALPPGDFIRLNKFYLINRNHFSHINENEKVLYLVDDFSIPVPHRISRYVLDLIKI